MLSWSHSRAGNSGIDLNRGLAAQAAGHGVRHGPDSGTLLVRDTSHRHDGVTMARDEARRDDRAGGAGGRLRQRH